MCCQNLLAGGDVVSAALAVNFLQLSRRWNLRSVSLVGVMQ